MPTIPNYLRLPKRSLSIYLLRETVTQDDVTAQLGQYPEFGIVGGNGGRLFVRQDQRPDVPAWVDLFERQIPVGALGETASVSAVFIIPVANRLFALTFGGGRFLLDDDWFEERFGYLAVLNLVDSSQLHTVDKHALDAVGKQTRVQNTRASSVREFGVDYERDLLRAVVGKPKEPDLGLTVTGTTSLRASVRVDLQTLPALLAKYLEKSRSRSYVREFPGIDQLRAVTDATRAAELDRLLAQKLNDDELEGFSLAVPQIVDWVEVTQFRFEGVGDQVDHNELELADLVRVGAASGIVWDGAALDRVRVSTIDGEGNPSERWSMRTCLFGECDFRGKHWILSSGNWYEVSNDLVDEVEASFRAVPRFQPALPRFNDRDEAVYCERVAREDDVWMKMDREPIKFGRGQSLVEFCDLFNLQRRQLVHVKRYSGSAPLSHLFQQALVSGEAFKTSAEFRRLANLKLRAAYRLGNHRDDPEDYSVVLGIVKAHTLDLPFFSKVTLRNSVRILRGFGYRVLLAHIDVDPAWRRVVHARPRRGGRG